MTKFDLIRKQKLTAKQWAWVIALAILMLALRELSTGFFFFVFNSMILVYAILLSSFIYREKFSFLLGIAFIGAGALAHWFVLEVEISSGSCSASYAGEIINYLKEVDKCIDYADSLVFFGQASVIAGSIVVISTTFREISKVYQFFRYEY